MNEVKTEAEIIQWAVRRSRARSKKSYPWHELQEIALAIEHGLDEAAAFEQAEASDEPLSQTLPSSLRKKHDEPRVAQLRAMITTTNWAQAEREFDEARRQNLRPPPAPVADVLPEPEEPGTRG